MIFRAFEKFSGMTKADEARPGGGTEKCRIEGKNQVVLPHPESWIGKTTRFCLGGEAALAVLSALGEPGPGDRPRRLAG